MFLDEDEVGDRITVRSDEELKAMLSYVSIKLFFVIYSSDCVFFLYVMLRYSQYSLLECLSSQEQNLKRYRFTCF